MTEGAPELTPHPKATEAHDEPFFNPTPEESDIWPNLTFVISEQNVFGGKLPTNSEARVRAIAHALAEQAPEAFNELQNQSAFTVLTDMKKWLRGKVTIHGTSTMREELYKSDNLVKLLWETELTPRNDPVVQIWNMITHMNKNRTEYNATQPISNHKTTLTSKELDELAYNLVLSFKNQTIKAQYQTIIQSLRTRPRGN